MANKYAQLADLMLYGIVSSAGSVSSGSAVAQEALDWAEGEFERLAGSQFDQQTVVWETPARAFVDRKGALTIIAAERGPVTTVIGVQIRVPSAPSTISTSPSWQTLAFDVINDVIYPPVYSPPHPRSWTVTIYPSNLAMSQMDADGFWTKWSYIGGYNSGSTALFAPLKMLILRLAWWKMKLREAPLGKVASPPFGLTEIIPAIPADIAMDIKLWQKKGG